MEITELDQLLEKEADTWEKTAKENPDPEQRKQAYWYAAILEKHRIPLRDRLGTGFLDSARAAVSNFFNAERFSEADRIAGRYANNRYRPSTRREFGDWRADIRRELDRRKWAKEHPNNLEAETEPEKQT